MPDAPVITPKPSPGDLPTAADATYLESHPRPGKPAKPVSDGLAFLFTGPVVAQLTSPAVAGFFGESLKASTLASDAATATEAAAVHDRQKNGAEAAKQLAAAAAAPLDERMHEVMARWPAFKAAHPHEAAALAAFRADWETHHKGGGHRKAPEPTK